MDDEEAKKCFQISKASLKYGGRLVTIDPVYLNNQSLIARFIISRDRGQNVRTPDQYLKIVKTVFSNIEYQIIHDMLRIPYTHFIMTCYK